MGQIAASQESSGGEVSLVGQFLGKYRILRELGRGGMGTVYQAEQTTFKRVVALKVVAPDRFKSAEVVKRFRREIQAAARLEHPNIVAAYDADDSEGVCFLVMEYVEGRDLLRLVAAEGPLTVERAVDYVLQAAVGLAYAHSRGIIHRDIKPANLLLSREGAIKILDLGLALMTGVDDLDPATAPMTELTHAGAVMGTVDYMSPEQAVDTHAADVRSDVYSLGCTMHYLLTGRPPYRGTSLMAKMLAHRDEAIPSLAKERADVSPELDAAFQRMLAKAAGDRFQTMAEVIAALQNVQRGASAKQEHASNSAFGERPSAAGLAGPDVTLPVGRSLSSQRRRTTTNSTAVAVVAVLVPLLALVAYFAWESPGRRGTTTTAGVADKSHGKKARDGTTAVTDNAADRRAAEWIVRTGGSVELQLGEGTVSPQTIVDFPTAPFHVIKASVNTRRYAAGDLERLVDLPELTSLSLDGDWQFTGPIPDSDLAFLQRMPRLESVSLAFLGISDAALAHLSKLTRLKSVGLYHSKGIHDKGVRHLRDLQNLHTLHLGGTSVTDAALEIAEGMPELEYLMLDDTNVTGIGLAHLKRARKLKWVHLANSQFNDQGLAALSDITWLVTLSLTNTRVTDDGLKRLTALSSLESLDLGNMRQITDAGINHLTGLPELRKLVLTSTSVTDAGVASLADRLPICRVVR